MKEILKEFTLLCAEDDLSYQKEMLEYFEYYFKKVLVVSNGEDALKIYKKQKPQVVVLDINMPKLDGLELTKYIKEINKQTKVIIISAYSQSQIMLKAINSNVDFYIIKPANLKQLEEMMNKISIELAIESKEIIKLNSNYKYLKTKDKLFFKNNEIDLSIKENRLLKTLIKNIENEVSSEELILSAWGENNYYNISVDSLKSQISRLRKKLPPNSIKTIYNGGYILKKTD